MFGASVVLVLVSVRESPVDLPRPQTKRDGRSCHERTSSVTFGTTQEPANSNVSRTESKGSLISCWSTKEATTPRLKRPESARSPL